jgi:hypothetical protein
MRVRIRRFTKKGADILALDFLPSRIDDSSALRAVPMGFTHFDCTPVPRSEAFGLPRLSFELLSLLILLVFCPSYLSMVLWPRLTPAAST